jgi:tight adherence protein C
MSKYLLFGQLAVAALSGIFVYGFMRWIGKKVGDAELVFLRQRISRWPDPAPRIWPLLVPFVPIAQRWARPSARLAKQLSVSGISFTYDDREFAVFRNVMTLFLASLTGFSGVIAAVFLDYSLFSVVGVAVAVGIFSFGLLTTRVSDRYKRIQRQVSRGFPNFLDVLSLTLESGKNFQSALQLSAQQLPALGSTAGLRGQLQELVRDSLASGSKVQALQRFAERIAIPEVVQFTAVVISAERQGVSVSALLRRQAEQLRTSQALAAERHAMKLPVKLLAPLAICIFPCTFLVLAFPLAVRLSGSGLF